LDTILHKNTDLFSRKLIRSALRAWDSSQELGEHPLVHLAIVKTRRRLAGYADTPTGRGVALRDVLRDAIEKLRPDEGDPDYLDKRWRPYIIITGQYIDSRKPGYLTEQLGIARSTYDHEQATALENLADILQQWEQNHGGLRPTTTSVIPRIQDFRGREAELSYYQRQLQQERIAVITGMPGIGKTALGSEIATRNLEISPVFWMTFGDGINTDIDSVFREMGLFLYELGHESFWNFLQLEVNAGSRHSLHAKIQHLIAVLEEGAYTLCFDDYHLVNRDRDVTTLFEMLRERATHGQAIQLIVMGHEKPAFAADMEIRSLPGLGRDDAQGLLADAGLTRLPDRLFDKIYSVTDGHPIFLQLFSAWVVKSGLAGFESDQAIEQVEQFVEGMTHAAGIETYLLVSVYNALNSEEQQLAELLSAFRLPFDDQDEAVIEIFVEEGVQNPALVLAGLVRKHIAIRVGGTGYMDYPPLIRQYLYGRLRGQLSLKRRLHGRIGEYYEHFRENHLEAAYHYREAADYSRALQLLDRYHKQLIGAGKAQRILETLAPLRRHQVPTPVWPLAAAIQGQAYAFLGEFEKALKWFEEALQAFEELEMAAEDRRRAAHIARSIGQLHGWRGEYAPANARMQQALRILGDLNSQEDEAAAALVHADIASLYYLQGQLDLAESECRRALDLLGEWDSGPVGATTYNVLGEICQVRGRWEQAVELYYRSRGIWEELGDRHRLAQVTDNLGRLYFGRGEFAQAEELSRQSLGFWCEVGARENAGYARLNLGRVCLVRGEWETTRDHFTRALVAGQQIGNQKLIAQAYNNLGYLEIERGSYEQARSFLMRSLEEDPSTENYRWLGEAELGLKNLDAALECASQSLALARKAGLPFEEALTLRTLGHIYQVLGNPDQARHYLKQSLQKLESLGACYEVERTQHYLALLRGEAGEVEELTRFHAVRSDVV
jgi:tetratricopeptide (TPR) repeat protein